MGTGIGRRWAHQDIRKISIYHSPPKRFQHNSPFRLPIRFKGIDSISNFYQNYCIVLVLGLVWLLIRFTSISVLTIQTRKQSLLYLFVGLSHIIPGWCVVYLSIHWSTINSLLIDRFKVCHNFAQLVQKEDNSQHKKENWKIQYHESWLCLIWMWDPK